MTTMTEREENTRVIWPGGHKNSIRATVTRHTSDCWTVAMSDRFVYSVRVTAPTVKVAWRKALKAILER